MSTPHHSSSSGSHLITTVLTPALRAWLRLQVDHVQQLALVIDSSDRQLIGGYVPKVRIAAEEIVYQGLHLGAVEAIATQIRVNWWQMLRGQTLQVMDPIQLHAHVRASEDNLNQSLQTPLLGDAVSDLLTQVLGGAIAPAAVFSSESEGDRPAQSPGGKARASRLELQEGLLVVTGEWTEGDRAEPIQVKAKPRLASGRDLVLHQLQVLRHLQSVPAEPTDEAPDPGTTQQFQTHCLPDLTIDLGDAAHLTTLAIEPGQLICEGDILVIP